MEGVESWVLVQHERGLWTDPRLSDQATTKLGPRVRSLISADCIDGV